MRNNSDEYEQGLFEWLDTPEGFYYELGVEQRRMERKALEKLDVDGYPKVCYICGEAALKTGLRAIEYRTTVGPGGRTVTKTTRHADCKESDG